MNKNWLFVFICVSKMGTLAQSHSHTQTQSAMFWSVWKPWIHEETDSNRVIFYLFIRTCNLSIISMYYFEKYLKVRPGKLKRYRNQVLNRKVGWEFLDKFAHCSFMTTNEIIHNSINIRRIPMWVKKAYNVHELPRHTHLHPSSKLLIICTYNTSTIDYQLFNCGSSEEMSSNSYAVYIHTNKGYPAA